jgi:acyl-coenzyme A synthetase/AMP-(fatty) acid ligase
VNFARDVIEAQDPAATALIALSRDAKRSVFTFEEVADRSARMATALESAGAARGEVVMTLLGSQPEWVFALLACFRIGAVALPCAEQLRASDLAVRIDAVGPKVCLCDKSKVGELKQAGFEGEVIAVPDEGLFAHSASQAPELSETDPALIVFTSGTSGKPKPITHGQRYLTGQRVQAEHWLGVRPGDIFWCTAPSGWSKSARNTFIAPWLCGATAVIQDRRFDPTERLETIDAERVSVLCMSPTEYRTIAKRAHLRRLSSLRHAVAAGEPLNPEIVELWDKTVGVEIRDGYGQTETGALTAMPLDEPVRPGSMGKPLPGFGLWVASDGELCVDPTTVPTFHLDGPMQAWHTGDRVHEDADGYLWFEGRTDDLIISSGYRIGPFEVESALISHPAVAEAACVSAPDDQRGAVVRAIVVLKDGFEPADQLQEELKEHVKAQTAPYKYPRIVEFAQKLPKTQSGKIKRAQLRQDFSP